MWDEIEPKPLYTKHRRNYFCSSKAQRPRFSKPYIIPKNKHTKSHSNTVANVLKSEERITEIWKHCFRRYLPSFVVICSKPSKHVVDPIMEQDWHLRYEYLPRVCVWCAVCRTYHTIPSTIPYVGRVSRYPAAGVSYRTYGIANGIAFDFLAYVVASSIRCKHKTGVNRQTTRGKAAIEPNPTENNHRFDS